MCYLCISQHFSLVIIQFASNYVSIYEYTFVYTSKCWDHVSCGRERDSMFPSPQNAIVSVKELCGLPPIASLKQCLLTLSSRLLTSDNTPSVSLVMKDNFPYLEPLGTIPDVQKKMLAAYDLVGNCDPLFLIFLFV